MAEALGVTSGVIGILSSIIKITQTIVQFGLDLKDAPKDIRNFMMELQTLKTILSETQTNLVLNSDFAHALQGRPSMLQSELGPNAPHTTETKPSIEACRSELEQLLIELKKRGEGHKIGWERLKAPFFAKSLQKSVDRVHRQCRTLNDMVSLDALNVGISTFGEVKQARKEQQARYDTQEHQKVLDWLSDLSFEQKHLDILSKRHPSTGDWFLDLDKFQIWREGASEKNSTLWCSGIPGAGKSVMTSIVVEHLQTTFVDDDVSVSYLYCDYKDRRKQTTANLFANLLKQLVLQQKQMPPEIIDLYASRKIPPALEDYTSLLSLLLSSFRRSFILVDALDEHFTNENEDDLLEVSLLDELLKLQHDSNTVSACSLFVTSRENPIFREKLEECLRLEIRASDTDIQTYLRSRIYDYAKFRFANRMREDPDLARIIITSLSKKAKSMFLLPRLHLDRLSCQTSIRGLRVALDALPTKLNETYDEAISRIQGQVFEHKQLAMLALTWISCALRPLRVEELRHALAIRPGDHDLDPDALPDISLVVSVSAGLITIDEESQTVRLVHFTIEEYFQRRVHNLFPGADILITETCMTYLSFHRLDDIKTSENTIAAASGEDVFLDYASTYWGYHCVPAVEHALQDQILDFLSGKELPQLSKPLLPNEAVGSDDDPNFPTVKVTAVRLLVKFCLMHILGIYLKRNRWSGIPNSSLTALLHETIGVGHTDMMELLFAHGVLSPHGPDNKNRTPLLLAARRGRDSVVKFLFEKYDVAADCRDNSKRTPLLYAAMRRHESIVRLLLLRDDVEADAQDEWKRTPLLYVAETGHDEIAKLLIDREDVDADHQDRWGRTPLWWATANRHINIIKFLLQRDVDPNRRDEDRGTPLSLAKLQGHNDIVEMLEEKLARMCHDP